MQRKHNRIHPKPDNDGKLETAKKLERHPSEGRPRCGLHLISLPVALRHSGQHDELPLGWAPLSRFPCSSPPLSLQGYGVLPSSRSRVCSATSVPSSTSDESRRLPTPSASGRLVVLERAASVRRPSVVVVVGRLLLLGSRFCTVQYTMRTVWNARFRTRE